MGRLGLDRGWAMQVAPSHWRSSLSTLMIGFMPLGELIGALVA